MQHNTLLEIPKTYGGLLLEIDPVILDTTYPEEKARELGLMLKPHFHVTIINSKTKEAILSHKNPQTEEERNTLLDAIEHLARSYTWDMEAIQEFFVLRQERNEPEPLLWGKIIHETRTTIVQSIHLPDMKPFIEKLSAMVDMRIDTPLPHVTLYSGSTCPEMMLRGIGVYSQAQFEKVVKERF